MKKKLTILMYLLALLLIISYFIFEIKGLIIHPLIRIIILTISCLFMFWGSKIINSKKLMKINIFIWFILYLILIFNLTLFDNYYNRNYFNLFSWNKKFLDIYLKNSFNIIPFKTIINYFKALIHGNLYLKYFILNIGGNIIAFMPFSFFLPQLFNKQNKFINFFLTITTIVIVIELLQFITLSGTCDIDDVILNVSGSIIMYKILKYQKINTLIKKIF